MLSCYTRSDLKIPIYQGEWYCIQAIMNLIYTICFVIDLPYPIVFLWDFLPPDRSFEPLPSYRHSYFNLCKPPVPLPQFRLLTPLNLSSLPSLLLYTLPLSLLQGWSLVCQLYPLIILRLSVAIPLLMGVSIDRVPRGYWLRFDVLPKPLRLDETRECVNWRESDDV